MKIFKAFGIPLIVIVFIIITITQVLGFKDNGISLFTLISSISAGLLFIIQLCYNNYYYLFKMFHKIKLFIKNPAVNWNSNTLIKLQDPIDFKFHNEVFYSNLLENGYDVKRGLSNNEDFKIKINNSDLNIHYDFDSVTIRYSSRLSYRDSLKELQILMSKYLDDYISNIKVKSEKVYELDINFSEYNPFYKLNIKHLEEHKIEKFILKANIEPLTLEVTQNRMKIRSHDKQTILEASQDYFAL